LFPLQFVTFVQQMQWSIWRGFAQGAICGAVFAFLLAATRRKTLDKLSLANVAILGSASGAIIPVMFWISMRQHPERVMAGTFTQYFAQYAVSGAICAGVSLVLARQAARAESTRLAGHVGRDELPPGEINFTQEVEFKSSEEWPN
jgi:hypothetical protein